MDIEPGKGKDRGGAHSGERPDTDGFQGLGLAIGVTNAFLYTMLGALLIFTFWLFVSIYAIVKWAGSAPDQPNPYVLVVGIASLVMLFVILFAVAVGLMGRGMNPKKRAKSR